MSIQEPNNHRHNDPIIKTVYCSSCAASNKIPARVGDFICVVCGDYSQVKLKEKKKEGGTS